MVRTRDFLLFLLTVGFLVLAITITVEDGGTKVFSEEKTFNKTDEVIYEAVLPEKEPDKRSERLKDLTKKIAKLDLNSNLASVIASDIENDVEDVNDKDEALDNDLIGGQASIDTCVGYSDMFVSWSPYNLKFEVVEGARIIYKEVENSDVDSVMVGGKNIVLQLPVRTMPLASKKCLANDIVGIALDGSLIRNDEQGVYGIFGKETLVGYALDGFPIYGLNDSVETDRCGGVVEAGQYRYYLSSDREGMIGCYSGLPVNL
ncbi:MAG: hypothetical protein R3B60_03930 [Candidatus Paceibacterota bacterium]